MTLEELRKIYPGANLNPALYPDEFSLIAHLLNRAEMDAHADVMTAERGLKQRPRHEAYFREELEAAQKRLSLVSSAMEGLGLRKGEKR